MKNFEIWVREKFRDIEKKVKAGGSGGDADTLGGHSPEYFATKTAVETAQTTANAAQTTANNAMPSSGGTFTGAVTCSSDFKVSGKTTMGRIDASNEYLTGSLYVGGKSSTTDGKTGVAFGASGNITMQGSTNPVLNFIIGTATSAILKLGATSSGNLTINGTAMGDFVVEAGTSDGWYYSKWNSGKAECYKTVAHAITGWSAWGSLFEGTPKLQAQSYPTGLFNSAPAIMVTATSASIGSCGVEFYKTNTATTTPEFFVLRPNNPGSTGTFDFSLYALGRWK